MTRIISFDIGNGFTKYVSSTRRGYFPSVYCAEEPGISLDGLRNSKDLVIELEGISYAVGSSAYKLGSIPIRTLDRSRIGSVDYRILFAAAMTLAAPQSGVIMPIMSLPVSWYSNKRDDVKKALSGLWQVRSDGKWLNYNVTDIKIVPEGFGSVCSIALDGGGRVVSSDLLKEKVGVIDIGTRTTDYLMFDRMEFIPAKTTGGDVGLSQVYNVMNKIAERDGFRHFDTEELDGVLHQGSLFDGPRDISYTASDWKTAALEQVANRIAGDIRSIWQGGKEVQRLLLTGGGAQHLYPYLRLQFEHIEPVANGPMANVLGGFAYAIMKYGGEA
jgi:plasmid segregation protein ParM